MQVQPPHSIFIRAALQQCSSVLMAEAATLALATRISKHLHLHHITILSDNQQLVHYMNGPNLDNPPDWRIKPLTHMAANALQESSTVMRRLGRRQNQMADLLARQAFTDRQYDHNHCNVACAYEPHVHECPLHTVLQLVTINSVMVLTASCC